MKKESLDIYWKLLRDNQIITGLDEKTFELNRSFLALLNSNIEQYNGVTAIRMTIISYCAELELTEQAVISTFVSRFIAHENPELAKKIGDLLGPLSKKEGIEGFKTFDEVMKYIKDTKEKT